mmetsp:Transcript_18462/g.33925  ORF Transcript_18462/g.33925 Transcript_18462/m.33925 type:complete len:217 (+) Transcript_18462:971-1621(+)
MSWRTPPLPTPLASQLGSPMPRERDSRHFPATAKQQEALPQDSDQQLRASAPPKSKAAAGISRPPAPCRMRSRPPPARCRMQSRPAPCSAGQGQGLSTLLPMACRREAEAAFSSGRLSSQACRATEVCPRSLFRSAAQWLSLASPMLILALAATALMIKGRASSGARRPPAPHTAAALGSRRTLRRRGRRLEITSPRIHYITWKGKWVLALHHAGG